MIVKKVVIDKADRLYQLAPELQSFIPFKKTTTKAQKTKLLDLASFNWPVSYPDNMSLTPDDLRPAKQESLRELRADLADWYQSRYGVRLNAKREVHLGFSTSQIQADVSSAFVDPGDIVFVPDLGIPLYRRATTVSGGQPVTYGISAKNKWKPEFERVNSRIGRVAQLLFLNSPHNPTGACLSHEDMANIVWIGSRENIAIVNDAAYSGMAEKPPVSLLSEKGGKKVGIEVGSFSYAFGIPRLPLGFAVGNREMISGLEQVHRLHAAAFPSYQIEWALKAVREYPNQAVRQLRSELADSMAEASRLTGILDLEKVGYETIPFLWVKLKRRRQSTTVVNQLYRRLRIQVLPGIAFGDSGEGYVRFSLTATGAQYGIASDRARERQRVLRLSRKQ